MSDFFVGQIMMAGFNHAPKNWAKCNGQLLPINQNQALFSLLGTQFGGNGTTYFALPNLQSRTPVGYRASADPAWQPPTQLMGTAAGQEKVALQSSQMPAHTHLMSATTNEADSRAPGDRIFATSVGKPPEIYAIQTEAPVLQNAQSVAMAGNGEPHSNLQPYLAINFCIALVGVFPPRP